MDGTEQSTGCYTTEHSVSDGIERVSYYPRQRKSQTPIVMQHGMWHGAWCWESWQALLATWGWESHAHSLPGHAGSPAKRSRRFCTLGYYLGFLKEQIATLSEKPIVIGHSMGGALVQRYLKQVDDELPAAILVGSWTPRTILTGFMPTLRRDPICAIQTVSAITPNRFINTPARAAASLITAGALYDPETLHKKLVLESPLVIPQHNPPFWIPKRNNKTPMLWVAGGKDAFFPEVRSRRAAEYYGADYLCIEPSGHNLMMEKDFQQTARAICDWLEQQNIS